jgi:hypothetical protein
MFEKVVDQETSQEYFWDPETNETSWTRPDGLLDAPESLLDSLDLTQLAQKQTKEKKKNDDYYNSEEYYHWYMKEQQQTEHPAFEHMASIADLHVNPSANNVDYSKAMKQMSYFFDVEKYQRERAAEILKGMYICN